MKIDIRPITDEDCFEIDLSRMFPTALAHRLEHARSWLCPLHLDERMVRVRLAMRSWLIRCGGKSILVDSCIGQRKQRPSHAAWHNRHSERFVVELAAAGLTVNDIDVVVCTHLHADHVGWNTRLEDGRWVPTFPRAAYAMSQYEAEYWGTRQGASPTPVNHGAYLDSILPVIKAGRALYVSPGSQIAPGLTVEALPGHTREHFGLRLESDDYLALFCGDAIHSPLQLAMPQWTSAFCEHPEQAIATRISMLAHAAKNNIELFPAHFRGAGRMFIRREGDMFFPSQEAAG